jgi:hypothetical protein
MNMEETRRWKAYGLARWGIVILGLLPTLTGCYPYDSNKSASDYDITITQFDRTANFFPQPPQPPPGTTYYLPQKVYHITSGQPDTIPTTYDQLILDLVDSNMKARQYTPDTSASPPDPQTNFIISVYVTTSTYYGYTYWGGWWGYDCYCYGGYYPYMQPYSFTTGTILINMADQSQVDTVAQTAPMIWGCAINGLLDSGAASTRITNQINQCFYQSQYLGPS